MPKELFAAISYGAGTIALEAEVLETDKTCLIGHKEIFGEEHFHLLIGRFACPFHPETDNLCQAIGLRHLETFPKIRLSFNIQSVRGTALHADVAVGAKLLRDLADPKGVLDR